MWTRRLAVTGSVPAIILVLASCSGRAGTQPIITRAEVIGTWNGPNGAVMTFMANQTVTVRRLNLGWNPTANCTNISAIGTWQFDSLQGASGNSRLAFSKSDILQIDFQAQPIEICSSQFTTWELNGPLGLCLYLDPDSPCASGYVLRKRHAAADLSSTGRLLTWNLAPATNTGVRAGPLPPVSPKQADTNPVIPREVEAADGSAVSKSLRQRRQASKQKARQHARTASARSRIPSAR